MCDRPYCEVILSAVYHLMEAENLSSFIAVNSTNRTATHVSVSWSDENVKRHVSLYVVIFVVRYSQCLSARGTDKTILSTKKS